MPAPRSLIIVACLIILLGLGWLLSGLGIMPEVNWVWVGGLGIAGLLTIALGGFNRFTLTIGPFLVAAAVGAFLREAQVLTPKVEFPALLMVLGILMLANLLLPIPNPAWAQPVRQAPPAPRR